MLTTGLTSVHDASLSLADIKFLTALDKEGKMPVRIYGMVYCEPINTFCGDEVERYDGDKFTLRWVESLEIQGTGLMKNWRKGCQDIYRRCVGIVRGCYDRAIFR